jgi:Ran GTPase-activating protein (RanGAP) involved in mRNA processing and transport
MSDFLVEQFNRIPRPNEQSNKRAQSKRVEKFELPSKGNREDLFPETPTHSAISFFDKGIGDGDISRVFQQLGAMAFDPNTALILTNNQFTERGMRQLAEQLRHNTAVRHLVLGQNQLTDFAVAALADMLKVNHHIGWLVLNKNAVGNFGVKSISEALVHNKGVIHLVLADNSIGDEGVESISDMLKVNDTIKSIFLQGNPIGSRGVRSLIDALKLNDSLEIVDLRDIGDVDQFLKDELRRIADEKNVFLKLN